MLLTLFTASLLLQPRQNICLSVETAWICWETTKRELLGEVPVSAEDGDVHGLRGQSLLLRLHNHPQPHRPSFFPDLRYHLCFWKQGSSQSRRVEGGFRRRAGGWIREWVPQRRTQISIMSQIWQSRSLCQLSLRRAAHTGSQTLGNLWARVNQRANPPTPSRAPAGSSEDRILCAARHAHTNWMICVSVQLHIVRCQQKFGNRKCSWEQLKEVVFRPIWKKKKKRHRNSNGNASWQLCSKTSKQRRGDLPTGGCKHYAAY